MFVLWLLTYLNFRFSPSEWVREVTTLKPKLYGIALESGFLPSRGFLGWFDLAYLAIGTAVACLLYLHLRRRMALVPSTWQGKAQLLYLVYLWLQVMIEFAHVLPRFDEKRLITDFVIPVNAAICTVLMGAGTFARSQQDAKGAGNYGSYMPWIRRTVALGGVAALVSVFAAWGIKQTLFAGRAVPYSAVHVRFGPNNTNTRP
jgi:hypothetical protein